MEASNHRRIPRRLLAFALTIILVLSLLPANLLTVWAETKVDVVVKREGNGTVYRSIDGEETLLSFDLTQAVFDVDIDVEGDDITTLRFAASDENGVVSTVKVGERTAIADGKTKESTVVLKKTDFAADNLQDGKLIVNVTFAAPLEETKYKVKTAASNEHVSVFVIEEGDTPVAITEDGRSYSESKLPLTVQISPESAAYEIQSVQVNDGAPITLDGGRFSLTKAMFNTEGVATISASAQQTASDYTLSFTMTGGSGEATIQKYGGSPMPLTNGMGLFASDLPANLKFTAPEGKEILSAKIGEAFAEISTDKKTATYELKTEDFGGKTTLSIQVTFGDPAPDPVKLVIPVSADYDVWVKNNGEEYQANPQTGTAELEFPAVIKVTSKDEKHWVLRIDLKDEDGNGCGSSDAEPARQIEMTLDAATYGAYKELTLSAAVTPVYQLGLSNSSSSHAQVSAFVKKDGAYPATGTEITASQQLTVLPGSDVKVTVSAAEGYVVTGVKVNDVELAGLTLNGTGAAFELTNVSRAQEIKVETEVLYTVKLKESSDLTYGTVKAVDRNGVALGDLGTSTPLALRLEQLVGAKLVFTANTGAAIYSLAVDETEKGDAFKKTSYEIELPDGEAALKTLFGDDHTLSAAVVFKQLFTLTIPAADHGVVAASCGDETFAEGQTYSVFAGDVLSFTATPEHTAADDYIVQSVELSYTDGTEAEKPSFDTNDADVASFSVTIARNVTVTVTFAKRASFTDISFYWGTAQANYLEPLYSTNTCQVYVFAPHSNSDLKLNMKIKSGYYYYPVFFNNKGSYNTYSGDDQYHYTKQSVVITFLSYAQGYDWLWGYNSWVTIKAPGSWNSNDQHMAIVIDKDKPTIELDEGCDGKYYSSAPKITISINEPADAAVQTAISQNKLPAEAASHAFSGLSTLYYYLGAFDETKGPDSDGVYAIKAYDAGSSVQSDALTFEIAAEDLAEGLNTVTVVAVDRAGNKGYKTISIGYNSKLGLTFDDVEPYVDEDDGTVYYLVYRMATILVRDTAEGFNESGISFTGDSTAFQYIGEWTPAEGEENTYTRRIRFIDGSYQLEDLCYTSKPLSESETPFSTSIPVNETFVVDTTKPAVTLKIDGDDDYSWSSLLTSLKFGVWKTGDVTVKATIQESGGIKDKDKEYYLCEYTDENDDSFLTEAQLKDLYSSNHGLWRKYSDSGISVKANKRVVIYFRVKDKAGHIVYVSTNGIITDNQEPQAPIELPAASHTHNGHNLYGIAGGSDVNVTFNVSDPEIRSGLKTVGYWITTEYMTDDEAAAGTGWTEYDLAPGANPSYADLTAHFNESIRVQKSLNSCTVYFYVKAVDNAGHRTITHKVFDVDYEAPTIQIAPDTTDDHVVLITYTERTSHFKKSDAEAGLTVTGTDGNNNPITLTKGVDYTIAWVDTGNENDLDTDTHQLKLTVITDAIYNISASFTDLAGNDAQANASGFTVDSQAPEGSITAEGKGAWDRLLDVLTFGLWSKDSLAVTGTAEDSMSGLQSVSYYKTDDTTAINKETLETVAWIEIPGEWGTEPVTFNVTTLESTEKAVIYLRLIDHKGNEKYLGTDGLVVDKVMSAEWITLTPAPDADGNGLYNREDTVSVAVEAKDYADPSAANSGIQKVECWIEAPGAETKYEELYSYEYTRNAGDNSNGGQLVIKEYGQTILNETNTIPAYEDLTHDWTGTIDVNKERFNSCEVQVKVKVTDNAGNWAERSISLDIDNTDPTIAITQDPEGCTTREGADEGYFSAFTALITYTERTHHFNTTDAETNLTVTATDAGGEITLERGTDYTIAWQDSSDNEKNLDTDTHVMEVKFLRDGNYKIVANYTDLAGNTARDDEMEFTLDVKAPDGTITVEGKGVWDTLLETLTFGLWSKDSLNVTGTAKDAVCNVKSVEYYQTDKTEAMALTVYDDDSIAWKKVPGEWTTEATFDVTSIDPDQKCVIYLRLMDRAGNVKIICTDGIVVEQLFEQDDITLGTSEASGKDAHGKPIYGIKDNVLVTVKVNDQEPWSGIRLVTYEITAPGCETKEGTLYSYSYTRDEGDNSNGGHLVIEENGEKIRDEIGVLPAYEDLTHEWNGTIPVDKARFNSCNTKVRVIAWDNAGNKAENAVMLDIDNTAPTIEVSYDTTKNPRAEAGYYTSVTATVTITERDHHFDPAAATAGIKVQGFDVNHTNLSVQAGTDYTISDWTPVDADKGDACTHVATITFKTDANYELKISYTDRATNEAEPDYEDTFTKDKTQPDGTLKIEKLTKETWLNQVIEALTFTLFSRESVEVDHTASDEISPLIAVDYFRTNRDTVYSETELAGLDESNWQSVGSKNFAAGSLTVGPDSRSVVYLRVIDAAGNIRFVSTNGFILDATNPSVDEVAPRVTVSQPVNGIYNTDVPIRVKVTDPIVNSSYSGLKEIRYEVKNMGTVTQSGSLYTYSGTASKQSDLTQHWENDAAITVDKAKNNSNNVEVIVYAVDNAGNEGHDSAEIKIDVTDPTISVSYDNNNGDTAFADNQTDAYFNAPRTATIVITERNFDPKAVVVTVMRDGVQQNYNLAWSTNGGGGNGDGTTHTAKIVFDADGDYTFAISCTDLAGNKNKDVTFNGLAPERFTIDMTKPTIEVRYDNNNQQNELYFNAPRTATITLQEHNFEKTRVEIKLTAKHEDQTISLPKVSDWSSSGDTHTATIEYTADGDYTFDISYRDKAGNENMPVVFASGTKAGSEFTVDTTPPEVMLTGVENESANSGKDKIGFTLTATDTNFNESQFLPVLTAYLYQDGQLNQTTIELDSYVKDVENGKQIVIDDLAEDGVYVLTCTVVDLAGNAFTAFDRNDEKGIPANGTENVQLLIFSVNRNGSTFYANDYTIAVLRQYYVNAIEEPLVIYEINPDKLESHSVSLNGGAIDSDITEEIEKNWYHYSYVIDEALFDAEGTYNLVVSSVDAAGNSAYSDLKGVKAQSGDGEFSVRFVVDRTAPIVTVSGLEDNGRYQTDLQTVTLVPADDGGLLGSLIIRVMDENGNLIDEPWNLQGEELQNALKENNGKISFTLAENPDQYYVYIECKDTAGNDTKLEFKEVTVSTSVLRIFWANKPLRWGSIGGLGGAAALFFFLLLAKKRKKKEDEVVTENKPETKAKK